MAVITRSLLGSLLLVAASPAAADEFFPLRPCRIVDTRLVASPPGVPRPLLQPGAPWRFSVRGPSQDLSPQGGNPAGCGVPDDATAVALNFTAVGASGAGHLRAWVDRDLVVGDGQAPLASILNYTAGETVANEVPLEVAPMYCGIDPCFDHHDFQVQADVSATEVVIDVYGYYRPVP